MTMLRTQFGDFFLDLLANFEMLIENEYEKYPAVYKRLFNVETTSLPFIKGSGVSGLGLFQEKDEGEESASDSLKQKFDNTATMITYSLLTEISKEALADDVKGPIKKAGKAMAFSAAVTPDILSANMLNNSFTTTIGDGLALCSTAHLLDVGTARNRPSTDVDLSYTGLETMLIDFKSQQKNHRGIKMNYMPKYLVHSTANIFVAQDILGSSGPADDANPNRTNSINDLFNIEAVHWPHLTSDGAWWLMADKSYHDIYVYMREAFNVESDPDISRRVIETIGAFRMDEIAWDWRGISGTSG